MKSNQTRAVRPPPPTKGGECPRVRRWEAGSLGLFPTPPQDTPRWPSDALEVGSLRKKSEPPAPGESIKPRRRRRGNLAAASLIQLPGSCRGGEKMDSE